MRILAVEGIRREHITHHIMIAEAFTSLSSPAKEFKIGNGRIGARQFILRHIIGVGAGTLGDDKVAYVEIGVDRAGRTYADNGLYAIEIVKFVGIDADRRDTHTMAHHTDALALIGAGKTKHTSDIVELYGIVEKFLCHELNAQGVTCHNHCLGDVAIICPNMGCRSLCHT